MKLKILIMAVIFTTSISGFSYGFDFTDQRIDVDATLTRMPVSDYWIAIKQAQASVAGMSYDTIATAEGLTDLSPGISTYLTVALLDNWETNTLQSTGKFEIIGGNLVRKDGADPFRDNPLITYINNLSQAGVVADGGGGGGTDLTPVLTAIAALETKAEADARQAVMDETRAKVSRIHEDY